MFSKSTENFMSQTILSKRSATPGKIPTVAQLQLGEIAINTHDGKMYIKRDNGMQSIIDVTRDPFPDQSDKAGMFLKTDGSQVSWSDSGGTATRVSQPNHGMTVGTIVRFNGSIYVPASAASDATADVVGIITEVTDANTIEVTTSGIIDIPNIALTPGAAYFLSATTPGAMTTVEPTVVGNISKPVFIALGANFGLFFNWRGVEISQEIEIDDLLPPQTGNSGNVLVSDGVSAGWMSISAYVASDEVQMANSFTRGQIVRATGNPASPYVLAQANNVTNAQVFGIISDASPTVYTVTTQGLVVGLSGLMPGAVYYLSDSTAGLMTTVEPVTQSSISKPVFIATSSTEGVFFNQRGLPVAVATATSASVLPNQSGHAGKFLTTNGTSPSWQTIITGVSSFNTRTGAITLTATDVTTALGATFVQNATNATNLTNGSVSNCTGIGLQAGRRISWPNDQFGGLGDECYIDAYSADGGEAQRLRLFVNNDVADMIELNAAGGVIVPRGVIHGTATAARYADLAEKYVADQPYEPGTLIRIGGEKEVTASNTPNDFKVIGIVSTKPAYLMNSECEGENVVAVALVGRVPCRVTGKVTKGDFLVSNGDGTAVADTHAVIGSVVAIALEDFDGDAGLIEVFVGKR